MVVVAVVAVAMVMVEIAGGGGGAVGLCPHRPGLNSLALAPLAAPSSASLSYFGPPNIDADVSITSA